MLANNSFDVNLPEFLFSKGQKFVSNHLVVENSVFGINTVT